MSDHQYVYMDYNATGIIRTSVQNILKYYINKNIGNVNLSAQSDTSKKNNYIKKDCISLINEITGMKNTIFTSGATESNNIIINNKNIQPYALEGDHPSLTKQRNDLIYIKSNAKGQICQIDLDAKLSMQSSRQKCLAITTARSITGIINPYVDIYKICKKHNTLLHLDVTQSICRNEINGYKADSCSFSGHKIGAMQGIGCLSYNDIDILPIMHGGNQQYSIRPGTENFLGILSLYTAIEDVCKNFDKQKEYIKNMRDYLESQILLMENIDIVGYNTPRAVNTSCVIIESNGKVSGSIIRMMYEQIGIICSYGAACTSGAESPPDELVHFIGEKKAMQSIRFSIGWHNTRNDIDKALQATKIILERINKH